MVIRGFTAVMLKLVNLSKATLQIQVFCITWTRLGHPGFYCGCCVPLTLGANGNWTFLATTPQPTTKLSCFSVSLWTVLQHLYTVPQLHSHWKADTYIYPGNSSGEWILVSISLLWVWLPCLGHVAVFPGLKTRWISHQLLTVWGGGMKYVLDLLQWFMNSFLLNTRDNHTFFSELAYHSVGLDSQRP